jgi:hypothetical protein
MQPAGNPIGMLAKVKRIKLFEGAVTFGFAHGRIPSIRRAALVAESRSVFSTVNRDRFDSD